MCAYHACRLLKAAGPTYWLAHGNPWHDLMLVHGVNAEEVVCPLKAEVLEPLGVQAATPHVQADDAKLQRLVCIPPAALQQQWVVARAAVQHVVEGQEVHL